MQDNFLDLAIFSRQDENFSYQGEDQYVLEILFPLTATEFISFKWVRGKP